MILRARARKRNEIENDVTEALLHEREHQDFA